MSEQPTTGITEESPGVRSSKRIAGIALVATGGALLIAIAIVALLRQQPMPNAATSIEAGKALVFAGAALLGVTVFEAFAK